MLGLGTKRLLGQIRSGAIERNGKYSAFNTIRYDTIQQKGKGRGLPSVGKPVCWRSRQNLWDAGG